MVLIVLMNVLANEPGTAEAVQYNVVKFLIRVRTRNSRFLEEFSAPLV